MHRLVIAIGLMALLIVLGACVALPATSTPPTTAPAEVNPPTIVPEASPALPPGPPTGPAPVKPPMSIDQAYHIAANSECAQVGQLVEPMVYNENTGTWWITLAAEKPGCNPACVVNVETKTAEVNWRCTGATAPVKPPMSIDQAYHIAANSECAQVGQLVEPMVYNENTGTWWIDLAAEKPGCSPACVVDVLTKTAAVNWRCKGLAQPTQAPSSGAANPASVNCEKQGGVLQIETRSDGGQFGVCTFPDGNQCEEWALFRGDCPVGGVQVTGYTTEAGRFCAISGGTYAATTPEQGSCTLKSGKICDAEEYYTGACTAE
jgi:uncharacterized protein